MLTIDDPEIERMIQLEVMRTGEPPTEVLRRALGLSHPSTDLGMRPHDDDGALDQIVTRNGIRLVPRRSDDPPVTPELVRRLLEACE